MRERIFGTFYFERIAIYFIAGATATALLAYTFMGLSAISSAASTIVFNNNFEDDTNSWVGSGSVDRTASGTNGISSAKGNYHGIVLPSDNGYSGPNTQLGGYNSVWPGEWESSIDTYLDPSWPVDTGFLYSVATNNTAGTFLRDYILHAGVINDETTANTNKLILIADYHGAPPDDTTFQIKHPSMYDRRVEVTQAGWYTISYNFRNIDGRLVVDITVAKKDGATIKTWTLDVINEDPVYHVTIPGNVGGNRYGWFTHVTVPGGLAIDNVTRTIGTNKYNVSQDAEDPVNLDLKDGQTFKIIGATDGSVTAPVDIVVTNSDNTVQTLIPAGTTISAEAHNWDGTLIVPAIQPSNSLDLPGVDISLVVKVGADTRLSFSNPVKLILPGQAGKKAGYIDDSNNLQQINVKCGANPSSTLTDGVNQCYQVSGNDLIVWTNHFSTYIAYTQPNTVQSAANAPNTGIQTKNIISPTIATIIGVTLITLSLRSVTRQINVSQKP